MSFSNLFLTPFLLHHSRIQVGKWVTSSQICQFRSILNSQYLQYFAIFDLKSLSFCGFLQYSFGFHSRYCEIHKFQLNPWYLYICSTCNFLIYMLWVRYYTGCVFPHFRGQRWPVFVWFVLFITSLWCVSFCNQYMHCVIHVLWILWYISDFFNIFSDLTSIYCEIHEILIICHFLVSSSNLCVQVSGCWLQERKGRDHCFVFCICFLKQFNSFAYSFIALSIDSELVLRSYLFLIWISIRILHYKSSVYL